MIKHNLKSDEDKMIPPNTVISKTKSHYKSKWILFHVDFNVDAFYSTVNLLDKRSDYRRLVCTDFNAVWDHYEEKTGGN